MDPIDARIDLIEKLAVEGRDDIDRNLRRMAEKLYIIPRYVGLGDADGHEISGSGYARQPFPVGNHSGNHDHVTFPVATAAWGTITHLILVDGDGDPLLSIPLDAGREIVSGDTVQITLNADLQQPLKRIP